MTTIAPTPLPVSGSCLRAQGAGPRRATVGRLVDADAGHAAGAADVGLAGPDVDRVPRCVVRVDRDRTRRVDPERAAEVLPVRLAGQRVLRAPDPTARRGDVELAVTGLARRRDGDGRRASPRDVLGRDVAEGVPERGLRIERLTRADRDPRALGALPARERPALCRGERGLRARCLRERDRLCREGALHERRLGGTRGAFVRHALVPRRGLAELCEVVGERRRELALRTRLGCRAVRGDPPAGDDRHHDCKQHTAYGEPASSSTCHAVPPYVSAPPAYWACVPEGRFCRGPLYDDHDPAAVTAPAELSPTPGA